MALPLTPSFSSLSLEHFLKFNLASLYSYFPIDYHSSISFYLTSHTTILNNHHRNFGLQNILEFYSSHHLLHTFPHSSYYLGNLYHKTLTIFMLFNFVFPEHVQLIKPTNFVLGFVWSFASTQML